jgi:hypothetical protein
MMPADFFGGTISCGEGLLPEMLLSLTDYFGMALFERWSIADC